MGAELQLHSKKVLKNGFVIEMKIWRVENNQKYPDGFKYSLIAVNPKYGEKILMDNHSPKGHHYHIGDEQFPYVYLSLDRLIEDFRDLVEKHLGVQI